MGHGVQLRECVALSDIIGVQGPHSVLLVCTISAMLHGQAHEHVSFSWALPARAAERT